MPLTYAHGWTSEGHGRMVTVTASQLTQNRAASNERPCDSFLDNDGSHEVLPLSLNRSDSKDFPSGEGAFIRVDPLITLARS